MKLNIFKSILFVILITSLFIIPSNNIFSMYDNLSAFNNAIQSVKEMHTKQNEIKTLERTTYDNYISYRNSALDNTDPVAITKTFRGLEGVTVSSVNALSLTPTVTVISTYDENSNQWCEGLEITLTTDNIEDTLLRIEKMQLAIISLTVKTPNTIIVKINIKGV